MLNKVLRNFDKNTVKGTFSYPKPYNGTLLRVASNFREFTKPIRAKVTIGNSNLTTTDANM